MAAQRRLRRRAAYNKPLAVGAAYGGSVFGPGTVADEMRIVDGLVDSLDRDIQKSGVSDTFKAEWGAFRDEWKAFHENNKGLLSRVLNQTYALVSEYRERVARWRSKFEAEGGAPSTPTPPDASKVYGGFFKWSYLLITGGVLGVGWYLLRKRE